MRTATFLVLAAALAVTAGYSTHAAQPPKKVDSKAVEIFKQVRSLMSEGRFDLAAAILEQFAAANPTDEDFYAIQDRYGSGVFQTMRAVPKWSDDPTVDKKTRDTVERLYILQKAAADKKLKNPNDVNKYIRNLNASFEERVYAENELRKAGEFAVPLMVEALRGNAEKNTTVNIVNSIPKLESHVMAGWLAAVDGLNAEQQYLVLSALTKRPDALQLQTNAQSDFVPNLWRIMAQTEGQQPEPPTRTFAKGVLTTLGFNPDKIDPRAALVGIARTFYDRKAKFAGAKMNPDGSPNTVPMWIWDAPTNKLVKVDEVPVGQAEEYFGLRYARWALEKDPSYTPAQMLVLALSAERAVERGKFGELSKTDPSAYALLAAAPADVLHDLMDQALNGNRTALVLALTQALGDRADKGAAGPRPGPAGSSVPRPSLLARALKYEDPRVQLAAANALLRSPVPVDPALRGQIVKVLGRAVAADPGVPSGTKGQVMLADPLRMRADSTAFLLRGMGYDVEVFSSGRDLLRRLAKSSDVDLIIVDHHIVNPELQDVMGHIRADANAARRPVLVIASTDKPRPPSFDMLLLRLALLIAATESDPAGIPSPYVPDLQVPYERREVDRRTVTSLRDAGFRTMTKSRVTRLLRVVESSGLPLTPSQDFLFRLRAEQLTLAVLAAEYPVSRDSAPESFDHFLAIQKQVEVQPPVGAYQGAGLVNLMTRIERLEVEVGRVPDIDKRYTTFRMRVDPEALGLNNPSTRDLDLEARIARQVRSYSGVKVIPEPYSRIGFEDDVKAAYQDDPAAAPRDPAEKKASAKLAVEWLRKMATGEIAGFDAKSVEPELRGALRVDDLAEAAIDAVARFGTAEAQQDLLGVALSPMRPLPIRTKAADATIRHIQTNGKSIPTTLFEPLTALSASEPDKELRGKLLVLKGLVATTPADYAGQLRNYNPPLTPVAPKDLTPMPPPKNPDPNPKKGPDEPKKP